MARRADLYFGYHRIQDAARLGLSLMDQAFPLTYQTPLARFSVQITKKLRWNLGWQHYNYGEERLAWQDYRAHTGYTSLAWSF
jgi:hypothetical protein